MALLDFQQQPVAALWELLPGVFRRDFGEAGATYPGDEVIAFLVDTDSELNLLMSKYCSADDLSSAISVFQCLLSKAHLSAAGRIKRRVLIDPAWQSLSVARLAESVARSPPVHTLVWLRDMSGAQLRRKCSAARRGRADGLALEGESRAKREHSELLRWREELAQLIKEAGLPVVKQALLSSAPEAVIIAAVGCPRASTIRKRVREWRKIRAYSMSVCGSPWPDHVGVLLDFILERVEEPCGHTVPESILATLAFMEKAGGVASGERLADNQALKNVVNQATHDLQLVAPPTRKAPLVPIMLIGSLELMVADDSAPIYARGLAFYKLLKIWASCRSNDLSGLNPSSLRLNSLGLCGVLERTKCSGPGKRVRHLPFFFCHSAALFVPNWLKLGWDIWDRPCLSFRRDYFLPLPKQDWSGARRVMADYADTVALSKSLFRMLRLPVLLGGRWKASEAPLFSVQAALRFWKEHSERNWLTSHLAAIGVAQTERDYVGRWHVASCSDEYVRTAQHVVTNLQERLVSYFCNPIDKWGLRNAGLDELKLFLQEQGEDADLVCLQYEQLYLPPGWCRRVPEPPAVCASPVSPPEDLPEETDNVKEDCPYFVTVVGKQRLRRLHRRGGCGVSLIDVQESEPAWSLRGLSYDLACKHCWAAGEVAVSEAEEADDSGESASCSDSSSDSSTEQESCS